MTRNEVIALGFTPMQIEIYLPPPCKEEDYNWF